MAAEDAKLEVVPDRAIEVRETRTLFRLAPAAERAQVQSCNWWERARCSWARQPVPVAQWPQLEWIRFQTCRRLRNRASSGPPPLSPPCWQIGRAHV